MIYGDSLDIDAHVKQCNSRPMECQVTTISDTIIKIDCSAQLNPDMPLTLKIDGLNLITANLLWKKNDEYGCQIDYSFHPAVIKDMMARMGQLELVS